MSRGEGGRVFHHLFKVFILEREEGRETWMCKRNFGCLLHTPNQGPGLQPRHVPWLGIEPVTFQFSGQRSIHWATPVRAERQAFWKWDLSTHYLVTFFKNTVSREAVPFQHMRSHIAVSGGCTAPFEVSELTAPLSLSGKQCHWEYLCVWFIHILSYFLG